MNFFFAPNGRAWCLMAQLIPFAVGLLLMAAGCAKLVNDWRPKITGVAEIDQLLGVLVLGLEIAVALQLFWAPRDPVGILAALLLFSVFTLYLFVAGPVEGGCSCGAGEQLLRSDSLKYAFGLTRNVLAIAVLVAYLVHLKASNRQPRRLTGEAAL